MSHRPLRLRRPLIPLFLAVVLLGELATLAVGARIAAASGRPDSGPAVSIRSGVGTVGWTADGGRVAGRVGTGGAADVTSQRDRTPRGQGAVDRPQLSIEPKSTTVAEPTAASFRGRNHVWIPALGINRGVSPFPCERSRPPDNYLYRWGCAGANNVYLMGHSYSVFKPLHDAYVSGRLAKGMKVFYADASGRVRTYAVSWWKTARPTTSTSWAWAAQSRPSMTLQTCVGANSEYRLFVRLVAVG